MEKLFFVTLNKSLKGNGYSNITNYYVRAHDYNKAVIKALEEFEKQAINKSVVSSDGSLINEDRLSQPLLATEIQLISNFIP